MGIGKEKDDTTIKKKTLQKCHFNFDSLDEIIDCLFHCIVYKGGNNYTKKDYFYILLYKYLYYVFTLFYACTW